MRSDQAKTISISSYLEQVEGIKPKNSRLGGKELWYNSPIRQGDKTPSFKVDTILNLWFDHGLSKGGKIIDLVCEIRNVSVREALSILENSGLHYDNYTPSYTSNRNTPLSKNNTANQKNKPAIEKEKNLSSSSHILLAEKELTNPSLIQYLKERAIDIEIAKSHLKEIHFKQADKLVQYFALGWKNGGGYDARNKYFKGYIGTGKNISVINPKANNELIVFEGFIDYLSYLTYLQDEKSIKEVKATVVVLNSTALKKNLIELVSEYQFSKAYFFLDKDISGTETLDYVTESLTNIELIDMSHLYSGYKDFNEWLCKNQA